MLRRHASQLLQRCMDNWVNGSWGYSECSGAYTFVIHNAYGESERVAGDHLSPA